MMTSAEIKFDENDLPFVEISKNEDKTCFYDKKFNAFLREVDRTKYRSIRVHKNNLRLVSDDEELVIKNIRKFSDAKLFDKIPSIARQSKKAITQYNRQNAKDKRKINNKMGRKKALATGVVFTMLVVTPIGVKILNSNDNEQVEKITEIQNDVYDSFEMQENITNDISYTVEDLKQDVEDLEAIQAEIELGETPLNEHTEYMAFLDYELSSDLKKKTDAYNNYHTIVEKYAAKWGISANIIMSILTQETGGYETNLMKIEFDAWKDKVIKVFNFNDNCYNYFVLTNNPEDYANQDVTCITEKDLENPVTNISIGCVLLRKSAEYMNYHVLAAIQCYNLGHGNMLIVLAKTEEETGQTREEILSDQENISFYQYTNVVDKGDPLYLSHVFAFLDDYGEVITFKHFGENNEIVEEVISIFSNQQHSYH